MRLIQFSTFLLALLAMHGHSFAESKLETLEERKINGEIAENKLKGQFPPDTKIEVWKPSEQYKDLNEKMQLLGTREHRATVGPGKYHRGGQIACISDGSRSGNVARCIWMKVCGIKDSERIVSIKGSASNTYDEYYYPCPRFGECNTGWAKFFGAPRTTTDRSGTRCVFWRFGNWKHDRARDVKLEVYTVFR